MIECIFTWDYELYGNGEGSLRDLVLDPTRRLSDLFQEFAAPLVIFAEAVELERIRESQSDPDIPGVSAQLRKLRMAGHEIGLHLHPWWANARYEGGSWRLDWREVNICTLNPDRIEAIVSGAIRYLREALEDPVFTPLSFRAGSWLMQPTHVIASVLAKHGLRVDSSVFKGGCAHGLGLDYRPALRNADAWRFRKDVNIPEPDGVLYEVPIHTDLVPFWRMLRKKRLNLQRMTRRASQGTPLPHHWRDFFRFRYPRKLDFCRMSFDEMRTSIDLVLNQQHAQDESGIIVAIGHSKDFVDADAVRCCLEFLRERGVRVTTFSHLLARETRLVI